MTDSKNQKHDTWHKDPHHWKWGFFYFNSKDKRLFPPKREKAAGWTINFANPLSILVHLIMLAILSLLVSLI
ncbi:MAG: DUF5808 domain-containing protein [Bacteroidota bacterium]